MPNLSSHAIHGNLDELSFENCRFGRLHAFAISPTLAMRSLTIRRSTFVQVDRHALKKLNVLRLTISECTFASAIPSSIVYEVMVTERLVITGSNFTEILPNAFQFEG